MDPFSVECRLKRPTGVGRGWFSLRIINFQVGGRQTVSCREDGEVVGECGAAISNDDGDSLSCTGATDLVESVGMADLADRVAAGAGGRIVFEAVDMQLWIAVMITVILARIVVISLYKAAADDCKTKKQSNLDGVIHKELRRSLLKFDPPNTAILNGEIG